MALHRKKIASLLCASLIIAGLFACAQNTQTAQAEGAANSEGWHVASGEGEVFMAGPGGRLKIEVLVAPEVSMGAFDVIQETHFKGFAPPLHHHPTASETFYVVKGRYTWRVGDNSYEVGPGDTVHVPANTVHNMISHDEGIVNMTYVPSGLVQRLRMSKAFTGQLDNPGFRASLTALTGHIDGYPAGQTPPEGYEPPVAMGPPMGQPN